MEYKFLGSEKIPIKIKPHSVHPEQRKKQSELFETGSLDSFPCDSDPFLLVGVSARQSELFNIRIIPYVNY